MTRFIPLALAAAVVAVSMPAFARNINRDPDLGPAASHTTRQRPWTAESLGTGRSVFVDPAAATGNTAQDTKPAPRQRFGR